MVLIWITFFTIIHNEEEFALTKATLHTIADAVLSDDKKASDAMMVGVDSDNSDTEF